MLKNIGCKSIDKQHKRTNKNNPRILKNHFAPSSRKFEIIIEPRAQGQEAWDPCQQDGRRLVHLALPKSLLRRDNWILEAWCSWREGGKARGVPNCYRQVRERSSFRVQGQRMWHPFLTCGLLYRRPTFSRARFDVEVVRERNFRFEIVRDRLTRFGRISKALVITTVCDFPSCFPILFVVESWKRVILRGINVGNSILSFQISILKRFWDFKASKQLRLRGEIGNWYEYWKYNDSTNRSIRLNRWFLRWFQATFFFGNFHLDFVNELLAKNVDQSQSVY